MWPRSYWKRFLIAVVFFLPLAVFGWAVALVIVNHGFSWDGLWTAVFVPVVAASAALVGAFLARPGSRIFRHGNPDR